MDNKEKHKNIEKVDGELVDEKERLTKLVSNVKDNIVKGGSFVFDKATTSIHNMTLITFTSAEKMAIKEIDSLEKEIESYREARDRELAKDNTNIDLINFYDDKVDKNRQRQSEIRRELMQEGKEVRMQHYVMVTAFAGTVLNLLVKQGKKKL